VDSLVFFFDRTFGTRLPKALASLKPPVLIKWHQEEGFAKDAPDDEWMAVVGPRKWICLSQDRKWHLVPSELLAVKQHAMKCFYLPSARTDRWITMCHIASRHEKIQELARENAGPVVFEMKANRQFYRIKLP
jgi:PIN like domain